jgi:hypothetical protein
MSNPNPGPNPGPEEANAVAAGYIEEFGKVLKAAAVRIDDEQHSWDDRVKTLHRLIELQILGGVAVTQALIKGPWWAKIRHVPKPSEPISVPKDDQYARQLSVAPGGSFVSVVPPAVTIPDHLIDFVPDVIPPGVEFIRIGVRDHDFSPKKYRGTVRLRNVSTGSHVDIQVTPGL